MGIAKPGDSVRTDNIPIPKPNLPSTNDLELLEAIAGMAVIWWVSRRPISWTLEQHFRNPLNGCFSVHDRNLALAIKDWCEHNWGKQQHEQAQQKRISQQSSGCQAKRAVVGNRRAVDSGKHKAPLR